MAMRHVKHIPSPPLSQFVDCFWYLEGYHPSHSRELSLPDGCADIIFNLGQKTTRFYDREDRLLNLGAVVLCGPHTDYFVIDTVYEARVIGIHFKPGGARLFVDQPLDAYLNVHLTLDNQWGINFEDIYDELMAVSDPEKMFRILEL